MFFHVNVLLLENERGISIVFNQNQRGISPMFFETSYPFCREVRYFLGSVKPSFDMIWSYVIDKVRMAVYKLISVNQDRIHQRNLKTLTYKISK